MYVLTELLICQVKEKEIKCIFENTLVEKSESSTTNKNGLVEGLKQSRAVSRKLRHLNICFHP